MRGGRTVQWDGHEPTDWALITPADPPAATAVRINMSGWVWWQPVTMTWIVNNSAGLAAARSAYSILVGNTAVVFHPAILTTGAGVTTQTVAGIGLTWNSLAGGSDFLPIPPMVMGVESAINIFFQAGDANTRIETVLVTVVGKLQVSGRK